MKKSNKKFSCCATAFLSAALFAGWLAFPSALTAHSAAKNRGRIVLATDLPKVDGDHLKATLVEVNYGPGESSKPHSHSCPVIAYIVKGSIRSQVKGEPEMTYNAGETFYEAPNGIHLVSANASPTQPAKFIAFLLCDHDEADTRSQEGATK